MGKILIFNHASVLGGSSSSLFNILDNLSIIEKDIQIYNNTRNSKEVYLLLKERGYDVIDADNLLVSYSHFSGSSVSFFSLKHIKNVIKVILSFIRLRKLLISESPDIIIINSMTLFWIAYLFSKRRKIRRICFHRETFVKGMFGFRTAIIKRLLDKRFDDIVFISKYDYNTMITSHSNKHVIYDKVSFCTSDSLNKRNGEFFNILYLGGVSKLKGGFLLLKLVIKLPSRFKLFFVIGEIYKYFSADDYLFHLPSYIGKEDKKFSILYNMLDIKDRMKIKFLPITNDVELYYRTTDMLIFPSTLPHQARPIYEAGFAKIPVLISDFKETNEFIINDFNGFTFKSNDINDLLNRIFYIESIYNTEKMKKIIANNYSRSAINHSESTLIEELRCLMYGTPYRSTKNT